MTLSGESSSLDSTQENGPRAANQPTLTKYLTTFAVLWECITFGCAFNFFAPLLVELKNKYETDIDSMSKIFIVLTFSYLVGAIAGGVVYGKLIKRQNGVAIVFTGISLSLFATPYCPTVTHLFIVVGFLGFNAGAYDTAQTVWIMEMWQDKSGPFLQAQHFCFALGSVIPSLLTAPFLSSETPGDKDTIIISNGDNNNDEPIHEFSSIIPFSIVGGMAAINVAYELFLITFFPYVPPERESLLVETAKDCDNVGTCGVIVRDSSSKIIESQQDLPISINESSAPINSRPRRESHKVRLVILSGLFLGFYQGMEMVSLQFIPTLAQYGQSKMSGTEAAGLLTGLSGAFAGGRAIGILITLKVSPQVMLTTNVVLVIVGNVILLLWAYLELSTTFLWSACIILGLGFSTMYASFCAFMERHLIFTDFIGCVMLVSGSVVGMIYPAIVGKFVEHHPEVVTFVNLFSAALCTLAFLMVYFTTRKSNRGKNEVASKP